MSTFDPKSILDLGTTDKFETEITLAPERDYTANIYEIDGRGGVKDGRPWRALNIRWLVTDADDVKTELGIENLFLYQYIFLDLNEQGGLASGTNKNVALGKIRTAVGQNEEGEAWSIRDLIGAGPAVLTYKHKVNSSTGKLSGEVVDVVAER